MQVSSKLDESQVPVIYQRDTREWWGVVSIAICITGFFIFACFPLVNMGPITPEEISKNSLSSNDSLIWFFFGIGVLFTALMVWQIWMLLFFQVMADENGLRWRTFMMWHSARWDEITDCVIRKPPGLSGADIVIGERKIVLEPQHSRWPIMRDYIAARVSLPDGLEPWREKPKFDAEKRRAAFVETNEQEPLVQRSEAWIFAFLGLIVSGGWTAIGFSSPNKNSVLLWIFLALIWLASVAVPIFYSYRTWFRCDNDGLIFGSIAGKRRISWNEIEDLFFLPAPRSDYSPRPQIVVAGETIQLPHLGKARDAILNRIESRALNSRSRQFELRPFAPVGADLPLPATLHFRAGLRLLARNCVGLALLVFGSGAGIAWLMNDIGWEYFGQTRGIFALGALGYLLLSWIWIKRIFEGLRALNRHKNARIEANKSGLTLHGNGARCEIAWDEIARLERDSDGIYQSVFRAQTADGREIEWSSLVPNGSALARLAREKSGSEWENAARLWREIYGIQRDSQNAVFTWNTPSVRTLVWTFGGMWAFGLVPRLSYDDGIGAALVWMVLPPMGFVLYIALFHWLGICRLRARLDAPRLEYRGVFTTRSMRWNEIVAVGSEMGFYDWIRARDGRVIRLWIMQPNGVDVSRHELRAEIERRAPHAEVGWKTAE